MEKAHGLSEELKGREQLEQGAQGVEAGRAAVQAERGLAGLRGPDLDVVLSAVGI